MIFCVVQEIPNTVGMKINDLLGVFSSRENAEKFINSKYRSSNNIKIIPYLPDIFECTTKGD